MKVLVLGASGFAGKCLIDELARDKSNSVYGTWHSNQPDPSLPGEYFLLDLLKYDDVKRVIGRVAPDVIYNLSGMSFPPDAEKDRMAAFRINVESVIVLCEAVAATAPDAKLLMVSSAEVYGKVKPEEIPLSEKRNPSPTTVYSATKYCMEVMSNRYIDSAGLDIKIARPFNHTGPWQDEKFVAGAFATQIAMIEAGQKEPVIRTGNLDVKRDFTDVRDVVTAYIDIMREGKTGDVYNICSEKPVSIQTVLDTLLSASSVSDIAHEFDKKRMRPSENSVIAGSAQKLNGLAGWRPKYDLKTTLTDLLETSRKRISATTSG